MRTLSRSLLLALVGVTSVGGVALAKPDGAKQEWREKHPRRAEVNERLEHQNKRINEGEKNGKLTPDQAAAMHKEDHEIRQQERQDAAEHNGHITKQEQKQLNREENRESRQIHSEKHPEAAPLPPAK